MKTKLAYCPNCDTELKAQENFCPKCGQENDSKKVSFKILIGDFFANYFSLDSKLFRSLIPLVSKPGYLALEFVDGKRASYIPPLRLYFVVSVLFFFVLNFTASKDALQFNLSEEGKTNSFSFNNRDTTVTYDSPNTFVEEVEETGMDAYLDSVKANTWIEKLMVKQSYEVVKNKGAGLQQQIFQNFSYIMFLLMPLFAFFLYLFFRRNNLYYVEHLVHSLYIHAFIFLLQITLALFAYFIEWFDIIAIFLCSVLFISVYSFLSLRKVYEYTKWGTLWRMFIIVPLYNTIIALGIGIAIGISLMLY